MDAVQLYYTVPRQAARHNLFSEHLNILGILESESIPHIVFDFLFCCRLCSQAVMLAHCCIFNIDIPAVVSMVCHEGLNQV